MNDRNLICEDGVELDFRTVFQVAARHLKLLLLAAVLGAGLAAAAAFFLIPTQYQSSVLFYVTNSGVDAEVPYSVSSGDLSTSRNLVDSYIVILKTREALLEVLRVAGLDTPYLELEDMITASAVNKTEFFRVTVTGPNPYQAEKIANAIGQVLPGRICAIIEGTQARVVEPAVVAWKPVSLGVEQYAVLGCLGGLLLALGVLLLWELAEGPVWNVEDVQRTGPYPVLACIPKSGDADAYRRVWGKTALAFADESPCRVLGLVGMGVDDSLTVIELARTLSREGKRVLLIEGNLAHPALGTPAAMEKTGGVTEFLAGQCRMDALFDRNSQWEGVTILPGGAVPPDLMELLGSARMRCLLDEQRQNYDTIVLNLGTAAAAAVLGEGLDGVLLAVRRGKTTRRDLKAAAQTLYEGKIRLLGILGMGLKGKVP